jgi:hypothetical protein
VSLAAQLEQVEGVSGGGAGLGQVGDEVDAGAGLDGEGLERQVEVADHRVVQLLHSGVVDADVVRSPPDSEVLAAGGQLSDQSRELFVVRVAAGLGAEQGNGVVRDFVPLTENEVDCGSRKTSRALFSWSSVASSKGNRARPSAFEASTSRRPLSTTAGIPGIASTRRWMVGRIRRVVAAGRRGLDRDGAPAVRRRSRRWAARPRRA